MYMLFSAPNILINNHNDPITNFLDGIFFMNWRDWYGKLCIVRKPVSMAYGGERVNTPRLRHGHCRASAPDGSVWSCGHPITSPPWDYHCPRWSFRPLEGVYLVQSRLPSTIAARVALPLSIFAMAVIIFSLLQHRFVLLHYKCTTPTLCQYCSMPMAHAEMVWGRGD